MNKYVYKAMFRSPKILVKILMQLVDRSEEAGIKPMVIRCLTKRDVSRFGSTGVKDAPTEVE